MPWRRRFRRVRYLCQTVPGHVGWVVRGQQGRLGLVELSRHKDGADWEVSYQFAPKAWGRGYAFEAVGQALAYAQEELGLSQVIAETQRANAASCALLLRLGFVEERSVLRFGAEQVIFRKNIG